MGEVVPIAVFNQQVPAYEIRQTRTALEAIVSNDEAAWFKFDACEEIAHLLKRRALYCRARLIRRAITS